MADYFIDCLSGHASVTTGLSRSHHGGAQWEDLLGLTTSKATGRYHFILIPYIREDRNWCLSGGQQIIRLSISLVRTFKI